MTFEYLRQSLFFFRRHLLPIASIQMPFLLTLGLLDFGIRSGIDPEMEQVPGSLMFLGLIEVLLIPLYWGATIFYMQSVLDGSPLRALTAISMGLSSWVRLLFTYLLNGLAIIIGLILFIVPGVYVGIRFSFADYICVLEGKSPMSSLKLSWGETDGYFWVLLQGFALIFVLLFALQVVALQLLGNTSLLATLVSIVINFGSALITIFGFRVFSVMREQR